MKDMIFCVLRKVHSIIDTWLCGLIIKFIIYCLFIRVMAEIVERGGAKHFTESEGADVTRSVTGAEAEEEFNVASSTVNPDETPDVMDTDGRFYNPRGDEPPIPPPPDPIGSRAEELSRATDDALMTEVKSRGLNPVLKDAGDEEGVSILKRLYRKMTKKEASVGGEGAAKKEGMGTITKIVGAVGVLAIIGLLYSRPTTDECVEKCKERGYRLEDCKAANVDPPPYLSTKINCPVGQTPEQCDDYCDTQCDSDALSIIGVCNYTADLPMSAITASLSGAADIANSPLSWWDKWGTTFMICGIPFSIMFIIGCYYIFFHTLKSSGAAMSSAISERAAEKITRTVQKSSG